MGGKVKGIQPRLEGQVVLEKVISELVAVEQMTFGKKRYGRSV